MTAPDADAAPGGLRDNIADAGPRALGSGFMVTCQVLLGAALLLVWQGASGRLVDNFFISNPVDVGTRLFGWISDGSLFVHIWATVHATVVASSSTVAGVILGVWLGVSPFAAAAGTRSIGPQPVAKSDPGAVICSVVRARH
jgi:NitT/TauT family transport system permease protein